MNDFANAISLVRARFSKISSLLSAKGEHVLDYGYLPNFRNSSAIRLLDTIKTCFLRNTDGTILNRTMTLEALVDLGTSYETTDQRDAIYALLSLANNIKPSSHPNLLDSIVPDYGKKLLHVFSEFILHCCRWSGSLDIICRPWAPVSPMKIHAPGEGSRIGQAFPRNIPSWIASRDSLPYGNPSWRMNRRLHGDPLLGSYHKRIYNAHYNTKPQVHIGESAALSACDGSLYAKGIILGKIAQRSTRMADAIITQECLNILRTNSLHQQSSLVSLPDVIWATLCADRDNNGGRAPSSFRSAMLHVLQLGSSNTTTTDPLDPIGTMSSVDIEEVLETDLPESVKGFLKVARDTTWNRRTFGGKRADGSEIRIAGLIPRSAEVGDLVCVLYGCSVPVVLRKRPGKSHEYFWELLGEAYVHEFMDGQGISSLSSAGLKSAEMTFEIR